MLQLQKSVLLRTLFRDSLDLSSTSSVTYPTFQSVKCQKKDWNSHKANCSLCPSGEIPDPDIPITEERDLEVERVANIVQSIMEAFKVD